jgi:hypothetical protein
MSIENRQLIEKIQAFIRRFYLNRLLKGLLLGIVLLILLVLGIHGLEFFLWLPSTGRMLLFWIYVTGAGFISIKYIFLPLYQLFTYRRQMSASEAARLIGKHFSEIEDRLLNTLQLQESAVKNGSDPLLEAAIDQRTESLAVYQFSNAIALRPSRNVLFSSAALLLVFLIIIIWKPAIFNDSGKRIVRYNQSFVKPLPFTISFPDKEALKTMQNKDYELVIRASGEEVPAEFYLQIQGGRQLMKRENASTFSYVFKKPGKSIQFFIKGGDYLSQPLTLEVFPRPVILAYEAEVAPPKYTGLGGFEVSEQTDFFVPEGSRIALSFYTRDTDSLQMWAQDSLFSPAETNGNEWHYDIYLTESFDLTIQSSNAFTKSGDKFPLKIQMIPDSYPDIVGDMVTEELGKKYYFSGAIVDDYGFRRLAMVYQLLDTENDEKSKPFYIDLPLQKSSHQNFYYLFESDSFNLVAGDKVEAYFEVWDNDAINGPKSKKTPTFSLQIPGMETLDSIADKRENSLLNEMDRALIEAADVRKELEKLLQDLATKQQPDWSDKQKLEDLFERQKKLEEKFDKFHDEQSKQIKFEEENQLTDKKLLKKQEEIQQLFDEVFSEEMKEVMEEIKKIMEELDKDQMQKMLQDLKNDSKKMEDLLDRNLNLLKQLKVEKEMTDLIESLEKLGEELIREPEDAESADQKSAQESKSDFEQLKQKLDSIQKMNEELDKPLQFDDTQEMEEAIDEDLKQSIDHEQQQQIDQSTKMKKSAGEKMKKMANMLQLSMQASLMQQQMEDAHTMRILLENIVKSSIDQEELMIRFGTLNNDDPARPQLIRTQNELTANFRIVEDSLKALARRQPMIENFIFDEIKNVQFRILNALDLLKDGRTSQGVSEQQYAFMAMNNLSLMLAESLENMQNSMGMPSPMNAQGQPKPGQQSSGKQQLQNMRQMQEALGKALEEMRKKQEGSLEEGKQGDGKPSMSEQLARMAAQQEAIRRQMQDFLNALKAEGKLDEDGFNEMIEEMEKLEEQLVNKQINQQLIQRQKEIVSRMLESEKSEEKREKEEKRESNEFKDENFSNFVEELTYKRKLKEQLDLLRLQSIELTPFYKERSNAYFFKKRDFR